MGEVVPKPLGRFRQYRKSIGLEVQDPDRLLVENLAGGREEVIGRFGAVVVDVCAQCARAFPLSGRRGRFFCIRPQDGVLCRAAVLVSEKSRPEDAATAAGRIFSMENAGRCCMHSRMLYGLVFSLIEAQYAPGVIPVYLLNTRMNALELLKPTCWLSSTILMLGFCSILSCACSMR